jgi:hypothetical protein
MVCETARSRRNARTRDDKAYSEALRANIGKPGMTPSACADTECDCRREHGNNPQGAKMMSATKRIPRERLDDGLREVVSVKRVGLRRID